MNRPYQPMTHPSIPPLSSQSGFNLVLDGVQVLQQQLGDAQETIRKYADIIISQANELTMFRNNMCQDCRRRFSPAFLSSSEVAAEVPVMSSSGQHRRLSTTPSNMPDRTLSRRQASPSSPIARSDANSPLPAPPSVVFRVSPADCGSAMSTWSVKQDTEATRRPLEVTFVRALTPNVGARSVRFSPDGKYLAVGLAWWPGRRGSGHVFIYDVRTGKKSCILRTRPSTPTTERDVREFFSVCFSPDGRFLATGHSDGQIRLFELSKKRIRAVFKHCRNPVRFVDFSSNGRLLASVSEGEGIRIWNTRDGSCKMILTGELFFLSHCIRFSPNARYIAAGDPEGILRIWDTRTGRLVEKWAGHVYRVFGVAFMSNELMSTSTDKTVKSWDVSSLAVPVTPSPSKQDTMVEQASETKKEMLTFQGHTGAVYSIAVSPDGLWVLSGSEDNTAQIWNVRDGSRECTLLGHKDNISSVDFSPAGEYLALGGRDGRVSIWKYRAI